MYDDYSYNDRGYGDDRGYPPDDRGPSGSGRAPPPPKPLPPQDQKQKTKVSYKSIGGMIVAIIALIMIFFFMSYPWYSIEYSARPSKVGENVEYRMEYNLDKWTFESRIGTDPWNSTDASYDDPLIEDSMGDVKEIMDNTILLHYLVMIFLILSLIFIPIAAIGKIPHFIGSVFLILALILIIIIPVYFLLFLPPAIENQFNAMPPLLMDPYNETFTYDNQFLASGSGTDYYDYDFDGEEDEYNYEKSWGPEMGFWMIFIPLITILVAQVVYASGKADLRGSDLDRHGPPRGPPPRERGGPVRDYGPPRPMRDDDYDYIPPDHGPPGRRPPPRGRGGYDYDPGGPPARPPRPPRPPRRRDMYQ